MRAVQLGPRDPCHQPRSPVPRGWPGPLTGQDEGPAAPRLTAQARGSPLRAPATPPRTQRQPRADFRPRSASLPAPGTPVRPPFPAACPASGRGLDQARPGAATGSRVECASGRARRGRRRESVGRACGRIRSANRSAEVSPPRARASCLLPVGRAARTGFPQPSPSSSARVSVCMRVPMCVQECVQLCVHECADVCAGVCADVCACVC